VTFLDEDCQDVTDPFTFLVEPRVGSQVEAALHRISGREEARVHFNVRIDAAGQYATNLETFLHRLDLPVTISAGEPKRNHDYRTHQLLLGPAAL